MGYHTEQAQHVPTHGHNGVNLGGLKRLLIGEPFPTSRDVHERLDKVRALAVFASDPISSNAYATEAIMSILVLLGSVALGLTLPIAIGIAILILMVMFSYIQTIMHYPAGGGAYTVAKDNLGTTPSLLAAAALLTDYVLTVSVSVSAGIRAITSAFPQCHEHRVWMAVLAILIITWANLRGVRESGTIVAFPTYAFVFGVGATIVVGLVRYWGVLGAAPLVSQAPVVEAVSPAAGIAYVWLLLRAFSAGCTALTGIEAISNGTQAFKPPESKNAAKTMLAMGVIAVSLLLGIAFLATHLHLVPRTEDSILSQLTRTVAGNGFLYYWVQSFTMLILIMAANTGYQDFPRLSSFLARDGFLPRWLQNRGDRLVFSYGIGVLAVVASIIVVVFRADEIAMLPLYALGVMLSFTLSQAGMVRLMGKVGRVKPGDQFHTGSTTIHYEGGWWWKRAVNAIGATTTLLVLLVLVTTKFVEGAWIVVVVIAGLVWLFRSIRAHYRHVAEALRMVNFTLADTKEVADVVIVPIADIHRGVMRALRYARRLSDNVVAVTVATSPQEKRRIIERWEKFSEYTAGIELKVIEYDYRDLLTPLVDYIERVNSGQYPDHLTTVVIPEFVPKDPGSALLHNQTANHLRRRLRGSPDVVVIDVPYHI